MAWITNKSVYKVSEKAVLYAWRYDSKAFAFRINDDINITVLSSDKLFKKNNKVFFFCYKCQSMFNPDESKIPVLYEDEKEPRFFIVISISLNNDLFFRACPQCSKAVASEYGEEIAQAIENSLKLIRKEVGKTYENSQGQKTKNA